MQKTAQGRYEELNAKRRGFITRCEEFARFTLPKICMPNNYDENSRDLSIACQSVGAQATNFLANKLMLAMFAPSKAFFRIDPTDDLRQQLAAVKIPEAQLQARLGDIESDAIRLLDQKSLRPRLYEALKHLIITGNVLVALEGEDARVLGIKRYVVRRSLSGRVIELIIADKTRVDELDGKASEFAESLGYTDERDVVLYTWVRWDSGEYRVEQWIDSHKLPDEFSGKFPPDRLPYHVLTWDLAEGQDYGTGLVEDYENDFRGLTLLNKSQIEGAILSSEFRWLVNPAGVTRPEDFERTPNGGAISGTPNDIQLVANNKGSDLMVVAQMATEYVNRIGRAFLFGSTMVRDAERVTAEEIRLVANELETSLGGAYSRLAVDLQLPLARWLLALLQTNGLPEKLFSPTIVTGIDALSRNGDLAELREWLNDVNSVMGMNPQALQYLNVGPLLQALAAPRRINVSEFIKSEEQMHAEAQQAQQQQLAVQAAQTGMQAGADMAVNQQAQE